VNEPALLALVGPTASGKTGASIPVALAIGAEIVSVDSMLVYRGMDVGTAKPSPEERRAVPHHLVDVADPAEPFTVAEFQRLAREAVAGIRDRGAVPLLVGGGGLYYRAVVDGLEFPGTSRAVRALLEAEARVLGPGGLHGRLAGFDPVAAARIEPPNVRRTVRALEVAAVSGRPFSSYAAAWDEYPTGAVRAAGIDIPRPVLHRRIERRVEAIMPGLVEEARALSERGFGGFLTSSQAIGYAESLAFLQGAISLDEAVARTGRRTKALARRQLSWLRRDPRIVWYAAGEEGGAGLVEELTAFFR
jgi:tRNA dimethylallyltransferase